MRQTKRSAFLNRRASVLIMVIAVLVLMALIGTAYVSVARIDRQAAATGTGNTQMSLLTSGVAQQVDALISQGVLVSMVNAGGEYEYYRPAVDISGNLLNIQATSYQDSSPTYTYHDFDSYYDDHDAWLASRVPQPLDVNTGTTPLAMNYNGNGSIVTATSTNPIVWPAVSILQNTAFTTNTNSSYNGIADPSNSALSISLNLSKRSYRFVPTWKAVSNTTYPAMAIYTTAVGSNSSITAAALDGTDTVPVLAADADGDGIADSLYFKLANQPDPGITYYGAVRIVDSNSAMNASTAWSVYSDFDGNSGGAPAVVTPNTGAFASNVGLVEMLRDYVQPAAGVVTPAYNGNYSPQMDTLNQYRFNDTGFKNSTLTTQINNVKVYADPWVGTSPTWSTTDITNNMQYVSYGDMLEMGLARRLDNPGYNSLGGTVVQFQSLSWNDQAELADRFCLQPSSLTSALDTFLSKSLQSTSGYNYNPSTAAYIAQDIWNSSTSYTSGSGTRYWYNDNFNYDAEVTTGAAPTWNATTTFLPRRALLVTRSPISDNVPWDTAVAWNPTAAIGGAQYSGSPVGSSPTSYPPNPPPTRANLNTSSFTDLLNAFQAVMQRCDSATQSTPYMNTPFNQTNQNALSLSTPAQLQHLRGALAAANVLAMRMPTYMSWTASSASATGQETVQAAQTTTVKLTTASPSTPTIFACGNSIQPFITEVVVNTISNSANGVTQWIGIKLYNPTNTPIDLTGSNWQLVSWTSGTAPATLFTFDASAKVAGNDATIAAQDYLWIVSGTTTPLPIVAGQAQTNGDTAHSLTPGMPGNKTITAAGLTGGINKQIVLVRPTLGNTTIPAAFLATQFAPVDQVDLSNMSAATDQGLVFYYARDTTTSPWGCVYPGASPSVPAGTTSSGAWKIFVLPLESNNDLETDAGVTAYNGAVDNLNSGGSSAIAYDNTAKTFNATFIIPLGTDLTNPPGPNTATAVPYKYPFGGFMRDGDAFQVFFIGPYMIANSDGTDITAMRGVSYDSAIADDGDSSDDGQELIGQFFPLGDPSQHTYDYDNPNATLASQVANHRYYFARYLLDYVGAVNTPNADSLPNISSSIYANARSVAQNANYYAPPANNTSSTAAPSSNWANRGTDASNNVYNNEYGEPISSGLININTAPWRVLAQLPMVTDPGNAGSFCSAAAQTDNILLAKAIVAYRDKYGPFTSVFDLNRVFDPTVGAPTAANKGFQNGWGTLGAGNMGTSQQDFTAIAAGASPAFPRAVAAGAAYNTYSAKDRLNMITRISNLVTTRSDSFTVYIVVEGWKNAGTASATRVSQTRQAYIVDRSHVNGINTALNIIPVPTN